jgi:DNA-binding NarL/FixJ family response regulator
VVVTGDSRFLGDALALALRDGAEVTTVPVDALNGATHDAGVVVVHVAAATGDRQRRLIDKVGRSFPSAPVVLLSCDEPHAHPVSAKANGRIRGVLSCNSSLGEIAAAVMAVHRGDTIDPKANGKAARGATPTASEAWQVTPREVDILQLLVAGESTAEIAMSLSISPQTVRGHVQSLLAKLGVHSRVEAVRLAREQGIVARVAKAATR